MAANIWRGASSVVKPKGRYGFVEDLGMLKVAHRASGEDTFGFYLFSEVGAGTKSLILTGLYSEVLGWLSENRDVGVINLIEDCPDIYMRIGPYRPCKKFRELAPFRDATQALVDGVGGQFSGAIGATFGRGAGQLLNGGAASIKDATSARRATRFWRRGKPQAETEFAIEFHYIDGPGFEQVGTGKLLFSEIYTTARYQLLSA